MPDSVTQWLEQLGLGQYAEAFEENVVGLGHLPDLDHEVLQSIGVTAAGHRMTILRAAANLDGDTTENKTDDHTAPEEPAGFSGEAERRQLTVMFCDLVGSTELSQQLDPEDLREINRAYQDACKASIERFDGYVARYMGDGVLAYFGYPQAHEDDAERAIHAGLGVIEAVSGLSTENIELGVRVSIATGPVVVGDIIGEGASQESAVVGETPNLAARLQGVVARNVVVVAPGTHELAAGRFEYEDLGEQFLKGIAKPVQAWRVLTKAAAESRFEAAHRSHLTPLVGRDHEIGLLLDRWNQAKDGDGQLVMLSGEPGIGKSRIIETLQERTSADRPVRLRYQCSPYYTNSALHPVIEQLERSAKFEANDTDEGKLDKLESLPGTNGDDIVISLLAALLSIPVHGRYPALEMAPERQREATLSALVSQTEAATSNGPVLLIFEDAHWADPTSLDLLERTISRAQDLPVLMLITFRPEFVPPWIEHTHGTSLTLNRFSRGLARKMVARISGGKTLPDEVLQQIVERTDGVPLFVEELTKTILESGVLSEESGRYVLSGPLSDIVIPTTLHDSLMARLDRLGAVKEVAQAASVIGREFDSELLKAISPLDESELTDRLDELLTSGLILKARRDAGERCIFKHALVQSAAYESLLKSKRQNLHKQIAEVLESTSEIADSQPEVLAHHLTEASLLEPAIDHWQRAGEQAIRRSANLEAISHFTMALKQLDALPDLPGQRERELHLQVSLGPAWIAVKGYAATEVGDTYKRAYDLCSQEKNDEQLVAVLVGLWIFQLLRVDLDAAQKLAEELLTLGQDQEDRVATLSGHYTLGNTLSLLGDFPAAVIHLDQALELYSPQADRSLAFLYGEDPRIASDIFRAWCYWYLGYPEQARTWISDTIGRARELSHPHSLAFALFGASIVGQLVGEIQSTQEYAEETTTLCSTHGFPYYLALGTAFRGLAMVGQGQSKEGIAQMRTGLDAYRATGTRWLEPYMLTLLAQAAGRTGQLETGLELISEAFDVIRVTREGAWEAELYNIKGELLLKGQDRRQDAEAESCFLQAIEIARRQTAKSWELRAVTSLGRQWLKQGKVEGARGLVSPVYNWFSEGFDTSDLKEAKALLDQLS